MNKRSSLEVEVPERISGSSFGSGPSSGPGTVFFCYECNLTTVLVFNDLQCSFCLSRFIEEIPEASVAHLQTTFPVEAVVADHGSPFCLVDFEDVDDDADDPDVDLDVNLDVDVDQEQGMDQSSQNRDENIRQNQSIINWRQSQGEGSNVKRIHISIQDWNHHELRNKERSFLLHVDQNLHRDRESERTTSFQERSVRNAEYPERIEESPPVIFVKDLFRILRRLMYKTLASIPFLSSSKVTESTNNASNFENVPIAMRVSRRNPNYG